MIYTTCTIPNATPSTYDLYAVLLSAFDSNGSYDQIGFDAYNGVWGLVYSWTTINASGGLVYHPENENQSQYLHEMNLSMSTAYTFVITVNNLQANFSLYYQNLTGGALFCQLEPTGGNYLILNYTLEEPDGTDDDYTVYEEVKSTATYGGVPGFNFYFYQNYWSLNGGPGCAPSWQQCQSTYPPPSSVSFETTLNAVAVLNVGTAPQTPICEMKPRTDGNFPYIPAPMTYLKIELLFSVSNLTGDQAGGIPWPSLDVYPDGSVGIKDQAFESQHFGSATYCIGWNPMADIAGSQTGDPDGKVDIKDMALISKNYGYSGWNNYIWPPFPNVNVTFNYGGWAIPDPNGYVQIPQYATNFTVTNNGVPIGAFITFWTP
jgi:hypothetical protein